MSLKYNGKIIPLAKTLRQNATAQENHLWYDFLSKHPVRFQRQKTIGNYIVDFYCHKAKLIIEIDGSQHFTEEGLRLDQIRTNALDDLGLSDSRRNSAGDSFCTVQDGRKKMVILRKMNEYA